ncbi:MAG: FtsX-like permease family protein [Actinobacteria bacterium]|nr:MAG: FtsX-like permease family protein [Actinomycetota bacterium]
MNLLESLRTAYRGLIANKLRSTLTMLGIIIGVGAVVAMISIGTGASDFATSRIKELGSNILFISPGSPGGQGFGGARGAEGTQESLDQKDAEAIKDGISTIKKVSPEYTSGAQVIYKKQNTNTSIVGATSTYEDVHNFHIGSGSFIDESDQKTTKRVAVLGTNVVTDLFGKSNAIGQTIKIKSIPFKVIGVMEEKGQSGFQNLDNQIFIPLSAAQKRLFGAKHLSTISIQAKNEEVMDQASEDIEALLLERHEIENADEADFRIRSQAEILDTMSQVTGTLTILLGGIAAISLIVGGIGIMNIMLVSVTERTREIGLRKAVGAKKRDILAQFLIESVLLSLLGGAIGLGLGWGGSVLISRIGGWPSIISLNSVLLAFFFAVAIGVFFGVWPARRASNLNPIEALRFE